MMKPTYKIVVAILLVSLVTISCRSAKHAQKDTLKPMPDSFAGTRDSINSANINWKNYFTDTGLVTLIDEGLKNNPDMSMALQRIEVARAGMRLNKSALFPTLQANASFLQRKFGYYTMDDAGNRTTEIEPGVIVPTHLPDYFVGLQTSWEIDVFGKLRNRKKAAIARYLASVEGKNVVITNLIADVANSYYELLALDNQLAITKETIALQENALELINAQREVGAANELAVKQFKAQVVNSKALEFEILQEIAVTENTLNFLLGRYPQTIDRDKARLNDVLPINPAVGIPSALLSNRPDIRQAEFEVMAAKADVRSAKAAFYPSLNINGAIGFQAFKAGLLLTNPQSLAYSALGSLAAPLLNRNAIKAEFKAATAVQQEVLFNYQKTILNGYIEVYNEVLRIRNLGKIVGFKTEQSAALTESIETSTDLFKTGRANYMEVLIAQSNALEAKLQLVDAKKRQFNATIDLYKALGGGWR